MNSSTNWFFNGKRDADMFESTEDATCKEARNCSCYQQEEQRQSDRQKDALTDSDSSDVEELKDESRRPGAATPPSVRDVLWWCSGGNR